MIPYYAVYRVKPLYPFNITEVTFFMAGINFHLSTASLLSIHVHMLQKCNKDLVTIHDHILTTRYVSTQDFKKKNANCIYDFNFKTGELVLVLNKWIEPEVGWKCRPCYFGPMVVVKQLRNEAYILVKVDDAILLLKFVAFWLIPYHPYF